MKKGRSTVVMEHPPSILGFAAVGGKTESEGPLGNLFDKIYDDEMIGQKSFEKAESIMQKDAALLALQKAELTERDIDVVFAGDLLNQCIGTNYGLRELNIPFAGVYGACSTMAESLFLSSLFIEGKFSTHTMAVTSSHFCSAERQYRFPLEYGGQRPPTSQWTATAAGAAIVGETGKPPYVRASTIGTMVDMGITDVNNMGAAMAPAAAESISTFLKDTGAKPEDFDIILTGDLGKIGSELLIELLKLENIDLQKNHQDCGVLLYQSDKQDVHSGGSGCGCSAAVLCCDVLRRLKQGELKNVLFAATGALMSPTANQQGESIPSIAHILHLSHEKGGI